MRDSLTKSLLVGSIAALIVSSLPVNVSAATGNWTSTGTSGNWTDIANWSSGTGPIADGSTFTANFTSDITATTTVSLNGTDRTIGNLVFSDNNAAGSDWVISGNTLTLDNGAGTPSITTTTNATISAILAGTAGFTKTGAGTLVLGGTNSFSGGVALSDGTLQISSVSNLPSSNALTFTGGTLQSAPGLTLANNVVIASGQSGTIKTISPSSGQMLSISGNYSQMAGTLTLDARGSAGFGGFNITSASGPASGAVVNLLGANDASNNVQLQINNSNAQTFFANCKLSITASGSALTYLQAGNAGGRNVQFGALDGGNASTQIAFDNTSGSTVTITGVMNGNYSGAINNGGAASGVNVVKSGSSIQTLSGTNGYNGSTTINAGTLLVSGGGINSSTALNINGGTLQLGAANMLSNTATVGLGGGTLATGGFSDTVGTLKLTLDSVIDLGTGTSVLHFADSSAVAWTSGKLLTITNWTGNIAGGGTDQIYFGSSTAGIGANLAAIRFQDPVGFAPGTYGAQMLSTGELVVVPEPGAWVSLMGGMGLLMGLRRRRSAA